MTTTDIERLLRQPAPDEPSMLPALVLPRAEPGGLRDRSLETTLGLRRVPWTMRIAIAAMLLAAIFVGALISGALRQLNPPLLRAGEFTGNGVALTYPKEWGRITPDYVIDDGSSVAMIASNMALDACSAEQVGTLTPMPASLAPDGIYYSVEDQYGKVYALGDRIYACVIEQPMRAGEIRVVLTRDAPQRIQIGPMGDFREPFHEAQDPMAGGGFWVPSAETGFAEELAGMPARFVVRDRAAIPGGDEVRTWLIADPASVGSAWYVQSILRGPDLPALRDQADAIARSFQYTDLPAPLDEATRDAALGIALDELDRQFRRYPGSRLFGCFPRTAGEATVTITDGPQGPLRAPVEVTCRTTIEPTAVRLWRARFTIEWPSTDGAPAGRWGQELLFSPDASGTRDGGAQSSLVSEAESASFPGSWFEPLPAGPARQLQRGDLVRVVGSWLQDGIANVPTTPGGPSETGNVAGAGPGALLIVADGPVRDDGMDWYLFDNGQELAWGVPRANGRPLVEAAEPSCPAADPPTVEDVVYLSSLVRHLCYGDRELAFGPSQYARRVEVGGDVPRHEPAWLATDVPFWAVFGTGGATGVDAGLPAVLAPGVEAPEPDAWVTVRGHFDDPASSTCRWTYAQGWSMEQLPPDAQVRRCAETFVITSFEPAAAP